MPMTKTDRVQRQIDLIKPLMATGPWTTNFFQWVDQTLTVLRAAFGEDSAEVSAFLEAAGDDVHDPSAVMIPVHTPLGTHARIGRCRAVLETAVTRVS